MTETNCGLFDILKQGAHLNGEPKDNFGYWSLFDIWNLLFGFLENYKKQKTNRLGR